MAAAGDDTVNIRFGATITELTEALGKIVDAVEETSQTVTEALADQGAAAVDTVSTAVADLTAGLADTGGEAADAGDAMGGAMDGVATGAFEVAEAVDTAAASIADGIGGAGTAAVAGLDAAVDGVASKIPELVTVAAATAEGVTDALGGSGGGAFESFGARASASISGVRDKLAEFMDFLRGVGEGMKAELGDQANAAFGQFGSGVREKLDGVKSVFASVASSANDELVQRCGAAFGVFGRDAERVATAILTKWRELPPAFQSVARSVIGAVAVLGAGIATKKFADGNDEMIESTRDLARALGITTNEASVMRAVLDDVGTSQSEYEGAAKGLVMQLKSNEDVMKRAGLVTRDAAGHLRPLNEMTLDAIKLLGTYKEGTDRATASRQIFGRGIDASSRLMLINSTVLDVNRKSVEELNLAVGESAVKANDDYGAASDRAALTVKALGKAISESVLPVATELTEWFNNIAPAAITVIRGALGGLTTAFLGLTNGVRVVWEVINAMVISVAEPIRALAVAINKAMSGDFRGAAAEMKSIPGTIVGAWETAFSKIAASSEKTRERIGSVWAWATGDSKAPGDGGAPKGDRKAEPDKKPKGSAGTAAAELALLRAAEQAELALQLEYLRQAQGMYEEAYAKNLITTQQFYDARLAVELRGIDLTLAAKRKEMDDVAKAQREAEAVAAKAAPEQKDKADAQVVKLKMEQVKLLGQINVLEAQRNETVRKTGVEYVEAERKLTDDLTMIRATRAKDAADAGIAAERGAIDQMRGLRQIDAEAAFTAQRALEQRSMDATRTFLAAKRAMIQGEDLRALAQQAADEEAAERAHQQRLTEIERAATNERQQLSLQAQTSIAGSFRNMVASLINGVTKLSDVFRNFAMQVTDTFVNLIAQKFTDKLFNATGANAAIDKMVSFFTDGVSTIVTKWFGAEQAKTAAAGAGAATRKGIAVAEAATKTTADAATTTAVVAGQAVQTSATVAGAAVRTTTEVASAATSTSVSLGASIANIGAKAWEAAAGVYAAIAAIPVVGPFLAPAAAFAAGAMVLGFIGNIASSEGGEYEVDKDRLNIVHKKETILPAPFAQGLRELVGNGGMSPVVDAIDQIQQSLAPQGRLSAEPTAATGAPGVAGQDAGTLAAATPDQSPLGGSTASGPAPAVSLEAPIVPAPTAAVAQTPPIVTPEAPIVPPAAAAPVVAMPDLPAPPGSSAAVASASADGGPGGRGGDGGEAAAAAPIQVAVAAPPAAPVAAAVPVPADASVSLARDLPPAPEGKAGEVATVAAAPGAPPAQIPAVPAAPVPADASASLARATPPAPEGQAGKEATVPTDPRMAIAPAAPSDEPVPADDATSLVLAGPPDPGETALPPPERAKEVAASGKAAELPQQRETAKALDASDRLPTQIAGLSPPEVPRPGAPATTPAQDVGKLVMNWQAEEERQNKPLSESKLAMGRLQSVDAGQPADRGWWRVPSSPLARIQAQAGDGSGSGSLATAAMLGDAGGGGRTPVQLVGASAGEFFIANRKQLLKVLNDAGRDMRKPNT